jgi:transposase
MAEAGDVNVRAATKRLGVSRSTAQRWLASHKSLSPVD